ncbi:MAG: type II secretion system F family protein [Planctomycetota bacterium]
MATTYTYTAKDGAGKTVSGTIRAPSEGEVVAELRKKNLLPVSVKAGKGGLPVDVGRQEGQDPGLAEGQAQGVPGRDRALHPAARHDAVGRHPMLESLDILAEQAETPGFKKALVGVVDEVRTGGDLSVACSRYPKCFSDIYVSMLKAGEVSGQIDIILDRLAEYVEAAQHLKQEIKSAMTYPVVSLVLVIGIAGFLMIGIVPQFKPVFESLDVELPGLTVAVMDTAQWLKAYWYMVIAGFVAAMFALGAWKKTPKGAYAMDAMTLRLPVFGPLFKKVALARFARTFATLVKSGVPILAALEIVSETAGNKVLTEVIDRAKGSVQQGETLSDPLSESPIFPPMVTKMISIGERSGSLETLLEKIATFYDEQVSSEVKSLTSLIEPIMIAIMGFLVGGIVLAVFLPIFKLQAALAK